MTVIIVYHFTTLLLYHLNLFLEIYTIYFFYHLTTLLLYHYKTY